MTHRLNSTYRLTSEGEYSNHNAVSAEERITKDEIQTIKVRASSLRQTDLSSPFLLSLSYVA